MMKWIVVVCCLLLVVNAQEIREDLEESRSSVADPIGDLRVKVQGKININKKDVASVKGYFLRLRFPEENAVMCRGFVEVTPTAKGAESAEGAESSRKQGAIFNILGFETPETATVFLIPAKSMKDNAKCYVMEHQIGKDMKVGKFERGSHPKCDGEFYSRTATMTTEGTGSKSKTRSEGYCFQGKKLQWVEMKSSSDNSIITLQVTEHGQPPKITNREDLNYFQLPPVCIADPKVMKDEKKLSEAIYRDLGLSDKKQLEEEDEEEMSPEVQPSNGYDDYFDFDSTDDSADVTPTWYGYGRGYRRGWGYRGGWGHRGWGWGRRGWGWGRPGWGW